MNSPVVMSPPSIRLHGSLYRSDAAVLLFAVLLLRGCITAQQAAPLSPLGTVQQTFGEVHQLAFDPSDGALYVPGFTYHVIVRVQCYGDRDGGDGGADPMTSLPLTPMNAAWWNFTVFAGRERVYNRPDLEETRPLAATFANPRSLQGWPLYAVGPTAGSTGGSGSYEGRRWAGMWVCEWYNHAIRFINFMRGGNVTLVAGSPMSTYGSADGVGTAALFNFPSNFALGRFYLNADATALATPTTASSAVSAENISTPRWTSLLLWSEYHGNCIRQGVPIDARTSGPVAGTGDGLERMVLNASAFVGLCGRPPWTDGTPVVGAAYQQPVLNSPLGIALVNPFSLQTLTRSTGTINTTTSMVVLFIAEGSHHRVSLIAPLYPQEARWLSVVYEGSVAGVTLARVSPLTTTPAATSGYGGSAGEEIYVSSIELWVAVELTASVVNVTTALQYHPSNSTITIAPQGTGSNVSTTATAAALLCTTAVNNIYDVLLVPFRNASFGGTLVVFSGWIGATLQFYCCLDDASGYTMGPGIVEDVLVPLPTRTHTSGSPSVSVQAALSESKRTLLATSSSASTSTSLSFRHGRTSTRPKVRYSVAPTAVRWSITSSQSPQRRGGESFTPSTSRPLLRAGTNASALVVDADSMAVMYSSSTPNVTAGMMMAIVVSTSITAVTVAGGGGASSFSTARAFGMIAVARRCYDILARRSNTAAATTLDVWVNTTEVSPHDVSGSGISSSHHGDANNKSNGSSIPLYRGNRTTAAVLRRLEFPDSAWPGFHLGADENQFDRGAAVAAAVTTSAVLSIVVIVLVVLLRLPASGWTRWVVRMSVSAVVAVSGLLSDGAVGGAALVGGAFTVVGLLVPGSIIALVVVAGCRRVSYFDRRYFLRSGPWHKVEALHRVGNQILGRLFKVFVGVGAWRLPPEGATREEELREVVAPGPLIGYRGPGATNDDQHNLWLRRVCVYYLAIDVTLATALSLARGLLVGISCSLAVGVITGICCVGFVLVMVLRPLLAPAKNVVAVFQSASIAGVGVVLLVGVSTASLPVLLVGITAAEWTAVVGSMVATCVSVLSSLLNRSMKRRSNALKKAASATGSNDDAASAPMMAPPTTTVRDAAPLPSSPALILPVERSLTPRNPLDRDAPL